MGAAGLIVTMVILMFGEGVWIYRLTKNYDRLLGELSRASAKVAQHKILVNELTMLIQDDADLNRCLREEVDGKTYERAREVVYEQNRARYDAAHPEAPWIPRANSK